MAAGPEGLYPVYPDGGAKSCISFILLQVTHAKRMLDLLFFCPSLSFCCMLHFGLIW